MTEHKTDYKLQIPQILEKSNWECYLLGNRPGGMGIVYYPQKGKVPNRFVRFMMTICFDCKWVKKSD